MSLYLPDLDPATREYMLREFNSEQAGSPFLPPTLSAQGRTLWPTMMRNAIEFGDDDTLINDLLSTPGMFSPQEAYTRNGVPRTRKVNLRQVAERLGTSEFNTWYVRGLAARFIVEGISHVMIYRAAEPKRAVAGCTQHEGSIVSVQEVYDGHRARYWPAEDPNAFSIPFQPGCHHSIGRVA
ncbi:hypothetical protein [Micromonospora sp. NBS 11-29]|uniref:hypothetical protein n=1 Tax=Micromonospora sp. NBS 11-29 TaxID=1960879 RepID=UPI000B78B020|nr:hypothetical protein [Micromonospora sp. NBS 11-29]